MAAHFDRCLLLASTLAIPCFLAAPSANAQNFILSIAPGSGYSDQCNGPCACPTILYTMSGRARARFVNSNPLYDYYEFTAFHWRARGFLSDRIITGSGTYQIGGEVALTQRLVMDVQIDGVPHHLDSGIVPINGAFPDFSISIEDSPHTSICNYVVIHLQFKSLCSIADITGAGASPAVGPDGQLTVDDLVAYLSAFFAGDPAADITALGAVGNPDDLVTVDDLIFFLSAFFAGGCT